jgi:hypothetical protein
VLRAAQDSLNCFITRKAAATLTFGSESWGIEARDMNRTQSPEMGHLVIIIVTIMIIIIIIKASYCRMIDEL